MAQASEWQRYHMLRDLIASAIEDAVSDNDYEWYDGAITIAISPDLMEVRAGFAPWWELGDCDGWNIETATSLEDAIGIADLYFDLR